MIPKTSDIFFPCRGCRTTCAAPLVSSSSASSASSASSSSSSSSPSSSPPLHTLPPLPPPPPHHHPPHHQLLFHRNLRKKKMVHVFILAIKSNFYYNLWRCFLISFTKDLSIFFCDIQLDMLIYLFHPKYMWVIFCFMPGCVSLGSLSYCSTNYFHINRIRNEPQQHAK